MMGLSSFKETILLIGKRPNVTIGKKSILIFDGFLNGNFTCSTLHNIANPYHDFPEFEKFDDFIKIKLGLKFPTNLSGLYHLYLHLERDEEAAFDCYFNWLNEFLDTPQ